MICLAEVTAEGNMRIILPITLVQVKVNRNFSALSTLYLWIFLDGEGVLVQVWEFNAAHSRMDFCANLIAAGMNWPHSLFQRDLERVSVESNQSMFLVLITLWWSSSFLLLPMTDGHFAWRLSMTLDRLKIWMNYLYLFMNTLVASLYLSIHLHSIVDCTTLYTFYHKMDGTLFTLTAFLFLLSTSISFMNNSVLRNSY